MSEYIISPSKGAEVLASAIEKENADKVFILTDGNVMPVAKRYAESVGVDPSGLISINPGDTNKNFESLQEILMQLSVNGASRNSLLVNIGGGMITDIGGFAAAVFKRGIRCINVSTSLLGAVDASIGGKTGINFNGLKNEIGVFRDPVLTIIDPADLSSLPREELLSGYAEMIKTGYIDSECLLDKLMKLSERLDDPIALGDGIKECLEVKNRVVTADPFEKGIRMYLNLGHTMGHAFESMMLAQGSPIPHGAAVAHGLLVALILSAMEENLPWEESRRYCREILLPLYPCVPLQCKQYDKLIDTMHHDKKAAGGRVKFVLVRKPGDLVVRDDISDAKVKAALDLYRDLTLQ